MRGDYPQQPIIDKDKLYAACRFQLPCVTAARFADQISVGPSFDFRLNQDSSVRSTTSLPAGYFRTRASASSSGQFTQACSSGCNMTGMRSWMSNNSSVASTMTPVYQSPHSSDGRQIGRAHV